MPTAATKAARLARRAFFTMHPLSIESFPPHAASIVTDTLSIGEAPEKPTGRPLPSRLDESLAFVDLLDSLASDADTGVARG
jgi:hypothetical protein